MTHVMRSGRGPEEALVLHCMLGRARSMDMLMARLADQLSMIAMDLPGHGQSEDWDPSRDYGEMCRDMAVGLLERPAHLIGHSYGAYTALRIAVDRPDLVRSLTLIEPVLFAAADQTAPDVLKAHKRTAGRYLGALAAGDLVTAARGFMAQWGGGAAWESLKPEAAEYLTARMPLVAESEGSILDDNGEVLPRLCSVTHPCLLIEGAQSPPVIAAIQSELACQMPQARREVVDGAKHMLPLTHANEIASLVAGFIANQPRSVEIN